MPHPPLSRLQFLLLVTKVWVYRARTAVLLRLDPDYLKNSLAARKGHCDASKCGAACCRGCHHLRDDLKCAVYDNRGPLSACSPESPLDPFEIKWFGWKNCSYYWEKD